MSFEIAVTNAPSQYPGPGSDPDSPELINFRALKNWLLFIARTARRRIKVVLLTFAVIVGLAGAVLALMPRTYAVNCRLLAQRSQVLTIRGEENAGGEASPTRSAYELITRRENLIDLLKRTNMLVEWKARREPIMRLKDYLQQAVFGPPQEKAFLNGLTDYLAEKIQVQSDDTTVSIRVDWRDPAMALRLVEAAHTSFLEARHIREVATIAEASAIMEGRAAEVRSQIDTAVTEIQALRAKRERDERTAAAHPPAAPSASAAAAARPAPAAPAGNAPPQVSEEDRLRIERRLAELPVTIDSKERTIAELEGNRIRRLTDLQTKLQEQRAVYTSAHPAVTDIEQSIAASSQESAQVSKLRSEVKLLRGEFDSLRLKSTKPVRPLGAPRGLEGGLGSGRGLGDVIRIEQESAEDRDPEIEYARSRLRFAITSYQALLDDISKARMDLATAEAAFKYRYVMVQPPEIPKGPIAPKVGLILTGAVLAGLFLGLVMAMALELRDGVVRENWQVETVLDLPVLCSIPSPELRRLP